MCRNFTREPRCANGQRRKDPDSIAPLVQHLSEAMRRDDGDVEVFAALRECVIDRLHHRPKPCLQITSRRPSKHETNNVRYIVWGQLMSERISDLPQTAHRE